MWWKVIKSHPKFVVAVIAAFIFCIYGIGYMVVAKSGAADVARNYAASKNWIAGDSKIGYSGFHISLTGQEGKASFKLVGESPPCVVSFVLEKSAGEWTIIKAIPLDATCHAANE